VQKTILVKKKLNFPNWKEAISHKDFSYPWRNENIPITSFKVTCCKEFLYFRFDCSYKKLNIYTGSKTKMDVIHSERIELFFRANEVMTPYYCLEISPNGVILDYKADYYRQFDYSWSWPDKIEIKNKIQPESYSVEGKISLRSLKLLNLINNKRMEIGLFRANCTELIGTNASIKWISWVNPKTEKPDFHTKLAFGTLMLP